MAAKTPDYDASLADHGFEAKELKGLTYPLAPDIGWTRMPVPGNLATWKSAVASAGITLRESVPSRKKP